MNNNFMELSDDTLDAVQGGVVIPRVYDGNLDKLLKDGHCTVEQVLRWNNLQSVDQLRSGMTLKLKF